MKILISTSDCGAATTFGQRARATAFSLLATGLLAVPATAYSAIVINFDDVGDFNEVGNFYNGVGENFDVAFSGDDLVLEQDGSSGLFENAPTPNGALALLTLDPNAPPEYQASVTLTYAPGFTSVSFFYAALVTGGFQILDGIGAPLIYTLPETAQSGCSVIGSGEDAIEIKVCEWTPYTVNLAGVATSIVFSGANGQIVIDKIELAPVPLPAAAWLLLSGLAGLGFFGRRRATAN